MLDERVVDIDAEPWRDWWRSAEPHERVLMLQLAEVADPWERSTWAWEVLENDDRARLIRHGHPQAVIDAIDPPPEQVVEHGSLDELSRPYPPRQPLPSINHTPAVARPALWRQITPPLLIGVLLGIVLAIVIGQPAASLVGGGVAILLTVLRMTGVWR